MRYLLTIALLLLLWPVFGQQTDGTLTIKNAEITVLDGTSIYIPGHLNDSTEGELLIDGRDYEGAVASSGQIFVGKSLYNKGNKKFNITEGRIIFNGTDIQLVDGNQVDFYDLELDKDTALVPYQFIAVENELEMTRGFVNLDSIISGVDLGLTGEIVGEDSDKRVFGQQGRLFARERNLSSAMDNIAGMGVSTNGTLGLTNLERFNNSQAGATDKGSIKKYFSLQPTNKNVFMSSIGMSYFDTDIDGFDERIFATWNSSNQGIVWNRSNGSVNTALNLVTGQSLQFGANDEELLTIADSVCKSDPVVSLHPTDEIAICEGESFELDAGNPGLFFLWSTGATTQQITVTMPGEYYVRVTDANGCYGTDTVEVVDKPFPEVDFSLDFECLGQKSIFTNNTTLSDPAGSLTFEWELGDGQGVISDENPETTYQNIGQYEITLMATSDFNCISTLTKPYVVHPLPQVAFSAGQVCEGVATAFTDNSTILPSIGLINYAVTDYEWDFGVVGVTDDVSTDPNPSFTYPGTGDYTVELIAESSAGCKDSTEALVIVKPVPVVDFTALEVCKGTNIEIDNLSTLSEGTLTYAWDFGDGTSATQPFPIKSFDDAGSYDISLTATSESNCSAQVTKSFEAYAIPQVSFTFNDDCEGESIEFTNTSTIDSDDEMTFEWTFEDGVTSSQADYRRTFSDPGDYTVTLVANTPNQCTAVTTRQVNIYPVPVADFSVNNVCLGEPIRPNNKSSIASGDVSYTWSIDGEEEAEGSNPALEITQPGVYEITLEVRSQNFCEDVVTREVEVYDLPQLDIPAEISTCGSELILDAGPDGTSYFWSDNSRGQTLTVTRSGTYEVTVTNAAGCSVSASTNVSLDNEFEPNLPEKIEACDVAILDAGNPGSQSYLWSTGSTDRFVEITESGLYTVEIVDQNGCPGSQEIEVAITTTPVLDLPENVTACTSDILLLDTDLVDLTHEWSSGETSQQINPTVSGRYSVIVTNEGGCSATAGVDVVMNPTPTVDLGEDRFACDSIMLDAANPGDSYLWSTGAMTQLLISEVSGEYSVSVTNEFGCIASDTVVLEVVDSPVLDLPETLTACSNESVLIDAENVGAMHLWSTGETSQTIEASATGTYRVTVSNEFGCAVEDQVQVTILPRVDVNLGEDRTICAGSELTLTSNIPDATYRWENSSGLFSEERSVQLAASDQYVLTVVTEEGCSGIDTLDLRVATDTLISRFLVTSEAFIGDTLQYTSVSVPTESNHFWRFGDGITSIREDPVHIFFRSGVYTTSLTVSKDGCSDLSEKSVVITDPNSGRIENIELDEEVNLFITPLLKDTLATVNIYPNQFFDEFTISLEKVKSSALLILFHDLNGKLWYAEEFEEVKVLERKYDWGTLPSGMYVVSFVTSEERISRRIIKK